MSLPGHASPASGPPRPGPAAPPLGRGAGHQEVGEEPADIRSSGPVGSTRAIVQVHPVKSLALSTADPGLNSRLTDAEFVGGIVLGSTALDGGDEGSSLSGVPITLLIATS